MSISAHEPRLTVLVEHLPLVTYTLLLHPPFRPVYVSPQLEPLFGYSVEDCLAEDGFWTSRIHPEDRASLHRALEGLAETSEPMSVEYRVSASDGREVWVRDICVAAIDEIGTPVAHGYLTDVTREKELERELARERAQTDAFFRDSAVGLAIVDAGGRYVRVNDALARMNDVAPADHVGRTLREIAPQTAVQVDSMMGEVQMTGVPIHQRELTVATRDGHDRVVLLSVFELDLEGARHYGRVVLDITDQRRAERERAQAQEQYRRLIEQLPLVTYVNEVDPSRSTYVSPQIEQMFGYPRGEWLGNSELWTRVVHPDDLEGVERGEAEARAARQPFELEYRVVRADGRVGWVLDLMETVFAEDGTPLYEQGFLVDITERRENERLFRAVFDNAFEAMIIADDDGRYVDVNPAACALMGRSRDELVGLTAGAASKPGEQSDAAFLEFMAVGEATGGRVVVRPDGEERETEFAAKANVLPGLHLSVMRDVTQRKELERELWRAQRLESVGRLAGGVAQDFNNMLTAIRGHAQLLTARTSFGSHEHHHASEIDRAAERAAALTAQLLAFGRRQTLQARAVDLNRLVEGLAEMARGMAAGRRLSLDLHPGLAATRVDPSQLEQLVLNLVRNAVDATRAGGAITLRTASVDVDADDDIDAAPGRYSVVTVADDGAGIDEGALEHLFEPFFTTKAVGDGTGLGLATAYGIAKQSGGTIVVESESGKGACFSVYLPEAAPAA